MNENEFDRAARAWLDDGPTRMSDRALSSTLQAIHSTRQRRALWPAWRTNRLNLYAKLVATAAAVLAVGIGSYQVIPGIAGPGTSPPPSPALLARGTFDERDWGPVEFEATQEGSRVRGRMTIGLESATVEEPEAGFLSVDLRCTQTTEDGLIMIGGPITAGSGGRFTTWPEGTLAGILLKRGSPVLAKVRVGAILNAPATQTTDCPAYLDASLTWERATLADVGWTGGTIELGP